jgi:hypothetical protein
MKEYIKIKLNAGLKGYKKGEIIQVEAKKGYPKDVYWKRRFRDSKIDNCVEIYKESKKSYNSKKGDE